LKRTLARQFDLRDVMVVDTDGAGDDVLPALGGATATYLDVTLTSQHVLGVSSWSETLVSAVRRLPVKRSASVSRSSSSSAASEPPPCNCRPPG
jgi:DNA-binding transcriptional regulator LsrR (DeoR family)